MLKVRINQAWSKNVRKMDGKKQKLSDLVGLTTKWKLYPNGVIGVPVMIKTCAGKIIERLSMELNFTNIIKKQSLETILQIVDDSDWTLEEQKMFLDNCTKFNLDWEEQLLARKVKEP